MFTPDLFPAELAAAQREIAENAPYEPAPPEEFCADEKSDAIERYWFWDDSDYARQVCVRRWGEI